MRARLLCGLAVAALALTTDMTHAQPVAIHKCVDAGGRISYQQAPCTGSVAQSVISTQGEVSAARRVEALRVAVAVAESRQPAPVQTTLLRPRKPVSRPPPREPLITSINGKKPIYREAPRCPRTRENPQGNPIGFNTYGLPSDTYLRNSGKMPPGC